MRDSLKYREDLQIGLMVKHPMLVDNTTEVVPKN